MPIGTVKYIKKTTNPTYMKVSGINKKNQSYYNNSNKYHGSNGTYVTSIGTTTDVVAGIELDSGKTIEISIKDEILEANPNWQNLTKARLSRIEGNLVNNKYRIPAYGKLPTSLFTDRK